MRCEPGEREWNFFASGNGKLSHRGEGLAFERHRSVEHQCIGTRDGTDAVLSATHPWYDRSVVEADDKLHFHPHFAVFAYNDSYEIRLFIARRHAVDHGHGTVSRLKISF